MVKADYMDVEYEYAEVIDAEFCVRGESSRHERFVRKVSSTLFVRVAVMSESLLSHQRSSS